MVVEDSLPDAQELPVTTLAEPLLLFSAVPKFERTLVDVPAGPRPPRPRRATQEAVNSSWQLNARLPELLPMAELPPEPANPVPLLITAARGLNRIGSLAAAPPRPVPMFELKPWAMVVADLLPYAVELPVTMPA